MRQPCALPLVSFALLTLFACGGAAERSAAQAPQSPPPSAGADRSTSPSKEEAREPASVEEAEAQIARARAELDHGRPPHEERERTTDTQGAPQPSADAASGAVRPTTPAAPGAPSTSREAACASPCRALASLRRAVEALCRMTGSEDARCTSARRTLNESVANVAHCSCHG
jgi:hypothetical protein